jgi:hypothetical protein
MIGFFKFFKFIIFQLFPHFEHLYLVIYYCSLQLNGDFNFFPLFLCLRFDHLKIENAEKIGCYVGIW